MALAADRVALAEVVLANLGDAATVAVAEPERSARASRPVAHGEHSETLADHADHPHFKRSSACCSPYCSPIAIHRWSLVMSPRSAFVAIEQNSPPMASWM